MRFVTLIIFVITTHLTVSQNLNQNILDDIKIKAKESHSDAIIIMKDSNVIYSDYFGKENKPLYIASAGKSLVSLAIGKLLDNKKLDSLDQYVSTLYPEWQQGRKKDITLRMLLNHTSGIQNYQNASIELEPAPTYKIKNIIKLALAAELTDIPGEQFNYNNKAVALLGGIVEKASGKRFDHFFIDAFYKPMNITNYGWVKDKTGNPTTHGAFIIKPEDFIKFGQLILNKGVFKERQIISKSWLETSLKQGQGFDSRFGLLWWRKPAYEKRIIDDEIWQSWVNTKTPKAFLKKVKPLKGILYETRFDFYNALKKVFGSEWNFILNKNLKASVQSSKRIYSKDIVAYYAEGFRGNYLVIVPEYHIVAVRCADYKDYNKKTDGFNDFVDLIVKLYE